MKGTCRLGMQSLLFAFAGFVSAPALAQSDTHAGDMFGDLVHILRDEASGVPILQKRLVEASGPCELPEPEICTEIAYCPIALTAAGQAIPFLPYSCEYDPALGTPVPVDYFGRLSAGRTKERNIRMHLDEVIEKIKASEAVWRDATGRLALGTGCSLVTVTSAVCTTWTVIDSPVENLALYARVMKYGHLQTNPLEIDLWTHGDPALPTQYHPALSAADHAKFVSGLRALLPTEPGCPDMALPSCFAPEPLATGDYLAAASMLGAASDKTGYATVDLVQYLNRILKLPVATTTTVAPPVLLFAKVRDCGDVIDAQPSTFGCTVAPGDASYPAPANERFLSYAAFAYARSTQFNFTVEALRPTDTLNLPRLAALNALLHSPPENVWIIDTAVPLLDWLAVANGPTTATGSNVDGFVRVVNDSIRSVEFVHNYEVPSFLGWDFQAP